MPSLNCKSPSTFHRFSRLQYINLHPFFPPLLSISSVWCPPSLTATLRPLFLWLWNTPPEGFPQSSCTKGSCLPQLSQDLSMHLLDPVLATFSAHSNWKPCCAVVRVWNGCSPSMQVAPNSRMNNWSIIICKWDFPAPLNTRNVSSLRMGVRLLGKI